jgi:hypothetical protein
MPSDPNPPPLHRSDCASGQIDDFDLYYQNAPPFFNPYLGAHGQPRKGPKYHRVFHPRGTGEHFRPTSWALEKQAMRDLNTLWRSMHASERAMWKPLAKRLGLPPYAAFAQTNLRRALKQLPLSSTP